MQMKKKGRPIAKFTSVKTTFKNICYLCSSINLCWKVKGLHPIILGNTNTVSFYRGAKVSPRLRFLLSPIEAVDEVVKEEPDIEILPSNLTEQDNESDGEGDNILLDDECMSANSAGDLEVHTSELGKLEKETSENLFDLPWRKNERKILPHPNDLQYHFEISDYKDK